MTEEQFDLLKDQNIATFNILAFSVCGQPGQIDDARFRNVLDISFNNVSLGVETMMHQLRYEAITTSVAAIKQRVEPTVEGQVKRLPPQECDERMRRLSDKITGFLPSLETMSQLTALLTSSPP